MTRATAGFTLLEVLITMIILAIGMLGLANLQSKIHVTEVESYQRAHAVLLLQDMVDRLNSNRANAVEYDGDGGELGTLSEEACDDATLDAIADLGKRRAAQDRCEWSTALTGASELRDGNASGGMIGARGCIEVLQAPDNAAGVCTPGIYRVTVAWQGLHKTVEPELGCGADQYGDAGDAERDKLRRVIATQVTIGLPRCSSP